MDKYEYKLKLEQMKNLSASGDDSTAAKIADSINWRRVRSASTLCMVGDIYSRLGRYENSREMYLQAYDRSPVGRNIVYKLAENAIMAGKAGEAEDYCKEFEELAPTDTKRYILRYRLAVLREDPVEKRIRILEELKKKEYTEEWVYELARLYQEAGDTQRCIAACDELVLWFGEGEYVEKALVMKRHHQSLSESQEEKYQEYLRRKSRVRAEEEIKAEPEAPAKAVPEQPAAEAAGNAGQEEDASRPAEKTENAAEVQTNAPAGESFAAETAIPDSFEEEPLYTINSEELEEELKRSMDQIMNATEKEAVSDTMDTIKKMVGDFPKLPDAPEETEKTIHVNEEILNKQINEAVNADFEEFLAEETDGQLSVEVPTSPLIEEQVPGQLSIEEVLAEWEKTKRAAEAALAVAEKKKLEVAKRKAIEEAQELIRRLQAETAEEAAADETVKGLEESPESAEKPAEAAEEPAEAAEEPAEAEEGPAEAAEEPAEAEEGPAEAEEEPAEAEEEPAETEEEPAETEEEPAETEEEPAEAAETTEEEIAANLAMMEEITRIAKEAADIKSILNGEPAEEPEEETGAPEAAAESREPEMSEGEADPAAQTLEKTQEIPVIARTSGAEEEIEAEDAGEEQTEEASSEPEESAEAGNPSEEDLAQMIKPEEFADGIVLTEEQKQLFTYFLPVPGMEEQICSVLTGSLSRGKTITSITGNIIIQGPEGSGKTVLAASLIKCIQMKSGGPDRKIGKISANALNKKDFASLIPKLDGGYVIIEKAGDLLPGTIDRMAAVMEGNTKGLVVLIEDSKSRINALLKQNYSFAKKFTEKITIPVFTIDELVDFGKAYAEEMECTIDEMGVLALYRRISGIQKLDQATTLTEVREIVDGAIESAEGGGIKKAFGVLFSKKYNENDYLILREKDFEM